RRLSSEPASSRTRSARASKRLVQLLLNRLLARAEIGLASGSPAPTRWMLRTVRASVPGVAAYSLSGPWRLLRRAGLRLRQIAAGLYSPDPDPLPKVARLEHCLREAARRPEGVVVLFLDEMGYPRWPEPAPTGCWPLRRRPVRYTKPGPPTASSAS